MRTREFFFITVLLSVFTIIGCSKTDKTNENNEAEVLTESKEAHTRDMEEGEGEEDGTMYAMDEMVDIEKNGVRLIISFEPSKSAFLGSIENISEKELNKVRVEIHLSNGIELGPTIPTTLKPGEKRAFTLSAEGEKFETWSTHAEVGNNEEGHEGTEGGEHDSESSEHDKDGREGHR